MVLGAFELLQRIKAEDRKVRFLLSRFLWKTGLCRFIVFERNQILYRFWPSSQSAQYWIGEEYLLEELQFIKTLELTDKVVVDIGANVGIFSLNVSKISGSRAQCIAFEPHPRITKYLKANIELNGFTNIEVKEVALGASKGVIKFSDKHGDDMNHVTIKDENHIIVEMTTLDATVENIKELELIKIDVEGFEREVLRGAETSLSKTKHLIIEFNPAAYLRYGFTVDDVVNVLKVKNFRIINENELALFCKRDRASNSDYMNIYATKSG